MNALMRVTNVMQMQNAKTPWVSMPALVYLDSRGMDSNVRVSKCNDLRIVIIYHNSYDMTINGYEARNINEIRNFIFSSALRSRLGCSLS